MSFALGVLLGCFVTLGVTFFLSDDDDVDNSY